jgi:hypothetical protein
MEHSGSYRFADHMLSRSSLRTWLPWPRIELHPAQAACNPLDASALFQITRCHAAGIATHCAAHESEHFRVLTVPCGLPRDVRDFAAHLAVKNPRALARIEYTGIDLDPEVIDAARTFLAGSAIDKPNMRVGNALDASAYPPAPQHFIASTGLGEFLQDEETGPLLRELSSKHLPPVELSSPAPPPRPDAEPPALLEAFESMPITGPAQTSNGSLPRSHGNPWKSLATPSAFKRSSMRARERRSIQFVRSMNLPRSTARGLLHHFNSRISPFPA